MKNKYLIWVVLISSSVFFAACSKTDQSADSKVKFASADEMVDYAKEQIVEISVEELHEIYNSEKYFLIDTRTKGEHQKGFIPGSINITRGLLEFQIAKASVWEKAGMFMPAKDDLIIVYCKKGNRAALAAQTLEKMGYTNVKSIKEGWKRWNNTFPELFEMKIPAGGGHAVEDEGGC